MKKKIHDEIKHIPYYGYVFPDIKRFDDNNYFTEENIFKYRLSKIKFFLGEKNGKELILGLQTFFTDYQGKEIANEEARDKTEKELDIKILEIPQSDYICNFFLKMGDDHITQIRIVTKKGKELIVGSDEGEEKIVDYIDDNKNHIILFLFGGYRKCLETISAGYIPIKSYLGNSIGFFELRRKVKDPTFKKAIEDKLSQFDEKDRILFKICNLPESCFNSIIRFCLF